jgi:hypothetical protein
MLWLPMAINGIWWPAKRREPPVEPSPQPAPHPGPTALIVRPDGRATLGPLPLNPLACLTAIRDAIGGYFEAVGGGGWVAYVADDDREFTAGLPPNHQADAIARAAGWNAYPGDFIKGTAVFLGRNGADEADVPGRVLELARAAGVID